MALSQTGAAVNGQFSGSIEITSPSPEGLNCSYGNGPFQISVQGQVSGTNVYLVDTYDVYYTGWVNSDIMTLYVNRTFSGVGANCVKYCGYTQVFVLRRGAPRTTTVSPPGYTTTTTINSTTTMTSPGTTTVSPTTTVPTTVKGGSTTTVSQSTSTTTRGSTTTISGSGGSVSGIWSGPVTMQDLGAGDAQCAYSGHATLNVMMQNGSYVSGTLVVNFTTITKPAPAGRTCDLVIYGLMQTNVDFTINGTVSGNGVSLTGNDGSTYVGGVSGGILKLTGSPGPAPPGPPDASCSVGCGYTQTFTLTRQP